MTQVHRRARGLFIAPAALAALFMVVVPTEAHVADHVGSFHIAVGWKVEPTYVGVANAVQVLVTDASDKPVTNLKSGDLNVVVTAGGKDSQPLPLDPGFDADEGFGTLGEYDAALIPTAPGEYAFHLTGSIRGQKVDKSYTSSETTFESVQASADAEFPNKLPTIADIAARLDRLDQRIQALQSAQPSSDANPPGSAALARAEADAAAARDSSELALILGATIGGLGLLVAVVALALVWRTSRRDVQRPT